MPIDVLALKIFHLGPAPSSGPQAGIQSSTTTPPSTPILSDDRAEDVSFRGTTVHNSLIRHRSNNFNGRSDGRVYIPPVGGVSAFVDSKFSGNSVILSQCNNNNGPGFGNDTT